MKKRSHQTEYDEETTVRCERALVTLLGDVGFWRQRIYLAGGLAPRYLVGQLPEGARAHVGTTDIDLVVGIALGDETPETQSAFANAEQDGPSAYALFLADLDDEDEAARLRREAVATVREFLAGFEGART